MYGVLQNINTACHFLPLPYLASIACAAPAALQNAVRSAYYQNKRVAATYHDCGFNYCSYYTYKVVTWATQMVRITQLMAKVGAVFAGLMLSMVLAVSIGLAASSADVTGAVALVGSVATVLFCTRVFRGDSEEVAPPRDWGRMTEKPTAGYVLAAWFALQAVSVLLLDTVGFALRALGALAYGLLALAFAISSLRLSSNQNGGLARPTV